MKLYVLPLGAYQTNCYIVVDENTKEALIVDPGSEAERVLQVLEEYNLTPVKIILTHGHSDHIGAINGILEKYDLPIYIHKMDAACLADPKVNLSAFNGLGEVRITKEPEYIAEGDTITCGNIIFKVIETPGHTRGGVCFYSEDGIVLAGDTLFAGSVGRTDFPGGSMEVLVASIKNKLFTLPSNTKVYPGHGPGTTIANEIASNPFIY